LILFLTETTTKMNINHMKKMQSFDNDNDLLEYLHYCINDNSLSVIFSPNDGQITGLVPSCADSVVKGIRSYKEGNFNTNYKTKWNGEEQDFVMIYSNDDEKHTDKIFLVFYMPKKN
jgi:hypothetical protein